MGDNKILPILFIQISMEGFRIIFYVNLILCPEFIINRSEKILSGIENLAGLDDCFISKSIFIIDSS